MDLAGFLERELTSASPLLDPSQRIVQAERACDPNDATLYMQMNGREASKEGRQDILCFIAVSAPLFEEQAGTGHMCLAPF